MSSTIYVMTSNGVQNLLRRMGTHPLSAVALVPRYFHVRNWFLVNGLAQLSDTRHQNPIRNSATLLGGGGEIDLTYFGQFE